MGRILYFCFANARPTGGNKIVYCHVEILRSLGLGAFILHPKPGFRDCDLNHNPPVLAVGEIQITSDDLVVLPEDGGPAHMCPWREQGFT